MSFSTTATRWMGLFPSQMSGSKLATPAASASVRGCGHGSASARALSLARAASKWSRRATVEGESARKCGLAFAGASTGANLPAEPATASRRASADDRAAHGARGDAEGGAAVGGASAGSPAPGPAACAVVRARRLGCTAVERAKWRSRCALGETSREDSLSSKSGAAAPAAAAGRAPSHAAWLAARGAQHGADADETRVEEEDKLRGGALTSHPWAAAAAAAARRASARACRTAVRTSDGLCPIAKTSSRRCGASNSSVNSATSRNRVRLAGRSSSAQRPRGDGSERGKLNGVGTRSGRRVASFRKRTRNPRTATWLCARYSKQIACLLWMQAARCRLSHEPPQCSHGTAASDSAEARTSLGSAKSERRHA